MWRQNHSSIVEHAFRVIDVLNDQSSRGQILKLPEAEARLQFPHLVVASLGAQRKDKPCRVISVRVLFDGPNGIPVNRRIRLRDQKRAPVVSDLMRCMRGKALRGRQTFSLTADVAEAHRRCGGQARLEFTGVPGRGGYGFRLASTGHTLPHRLDGLLNIFQDDEPLCGINWWLMISTLKLGEVIIEH